MAKYLVETYYTCTFKVNHYLDDINETELKNLEKRDDGKFEVLDVKLDNRKTKSLDPNNNKVIESKKVEVVAETSQTSSSNKESIISKIPSARLGEPDDIANAVHFLASNQSNYINGETLHVNGGMYMAWQNKFLN